MKTGFLALLYIIITMSASYADDVELRDLIKQAWKNSPLLKEVSADRNILDAAETLALSYHFPVVSFSQSFVGSTNPVNSFAFKLTQERLTQQDFFNLDKLNNPDFSPSHISSFTVKVPLFMGFRLMKEKESLTLKKESMEYRKKWVQKVIQRNLYALYHAWVNLKGFEEFLIREDRYLNKLLSVYDEKSKRNKNRYLSYNQGRIISETIQEALNEVREQQNKIVSDMSYISGTTVTSIKTSGSDLLDRVDWKKLTGSNPIREDLVSAGKFLDAAKADVKKEQGSYWPTVGAFANYSIYTEKFKDTGRDYTVGVQLTWDFSFSEYQGVKVARMKKARAAATHDKMKAEIQTQLSKLRSDLVALEEKIKRHKNKDRLFLENKKILSSQYRRGSINLYNLLDNFAHYIENRGNISRLESDYRARLIQYVDHYAEL